jgi:hypothetical protein
MNKQALLPVFGIILLAHAPSTAYGQQLAAGDTIRVRASQSAEPGHQWIEATVVRLTPDTLWYEASGSALAMSLDNAEMRRATDRNHRWRGLGIGALAGGAVGALAAYSSFEPRFVYEDPGCLLLAIFVLCDPGPQVQVNSQGEETVSGAVGGALIGGALGFFAGKALGHWETVELDQLTVRDGSLAVSMRVRR